MEYDEEYIGESARTFEEVQRTPQGLSPIYDHSNIMGQTTTVDNFGIVRRDDQKLNRTMKESIYIRISVPSINKNIGKYHLMHIWDEVQFNAPVPKFKRTTLIKIGQSIHSTLT